MHLTPALKALGYYQSSAPRTHLPTKSADLFGKRNHERQSRAHQQTRLLHDCR